MTMKRTISLLLILALMLGALAACGSAAESAETTAAPTEEPAVTVEPTAEPTEEPAQVEETAESVTINIAGLKGPTSIGMIQLMDNAEAGVAANDYNFTIAGSADEITPLLIKGELDIAAVPANLASVLYNKTEGQIQVLAVNTLGVLYIVERGESISSVADLKGKTIYATGKGSTPEYNLRYLLEQNGIDPDNDVTIEFKSEPTEVVAVLSEDESAVAMLPQPYVTVAGNSIEDLRIALDLTSEWDSLGSGSTMITGVVVARTEFVEQHPEAVAAFLEEYEASTDFVNGDVAKAAQLVEKFDIFKAAIAEKAIPYCNITFISGSRMKSELEGYLTVLYDQNPESVGGAMPADDFYYQGA
jgi:NitT/TauT family transport system substrate-binding protein